MKRIITYIATAFTLSAFITTVHFTTTSAETATQQTRSTTTPTETQQTRLATIITKGDQEIARRLTALNKLSAVISSNAKLSTTDKQVLTTEVASAIAGLTQLKTKLDAETTLDGARVDAKSIVTEYRVYALVTPKVHLIKVADSLTAAETKLTEVAAKLQQRISDVKAAGKDTSVSETALTNMLTKIASAQSITTSVQTRVIAFQPSDYNSDHTVLLGLDAQLKTARQNLIDARANAKTVVEGIKSLEKK